MNRTIPSIIALRIAGLDRQRFNDAVKAGLYTCAPATQKGSSRSFDIPGVMGLITFKALLDAGVTPRHAGPLACEVVEQARRSDVEVRSLELRFRESRSFPYVWANGAPVSEGSWPLRTILDLSDMRRRVLAGLNSTTPDQIERAATADELTLTDEDEAALDEAERRREAVTRQSGRK